MQLLDRIVGRIFTKLHGSLFKCSHAGIQKDIHLGENVALLYTAFTGKRVTLCRTDGIILQHLKVAKLQISTLLF